MKSTVTTKSIGSNKIIKPKLPRSKKPIVIARAGEQILEYSKKTKKMLAEWTNSNLNWDDFSYREHTIEDDFKSRGVRQTLKIHQGHKKSISNRPPSQPLAEHLQSSYINTGRRKREKTTKN